MPIVNKDLKPCPFCGAKVEIEDIGSCLDISCCCYMEIQKVDMLSMEQRETYNNSTFKYSDEVEQFVYDEFVELWNQRID